MKFRSLLLLLARRLPSLRTVRDFLPTAWLKFRPARRTNAAFAPALLVDWPEPER